MLLEHLMLLIVRLHMQLHNLVIAVFSLQVRLSDAVFSSEGCYIDGAE